jgi:hypothetical protein
MQREGAGRSLHRLIGEAVMRGTHIQEESRAAVAATHAATAALALTVAEVRRGRARRAFGNGQSHAEVPEKAG